MATTSKSNASSAAALAQQAYQRGDYAEAIQQQQTAVAQLDQAQQSSADARKLLSLYFYGSGKLEESLELLKALQTETPEDVEAFENAGVILGQLKRREESVEMLLKAHEMLPTRANICDALAAAYHHLEQEEEMQKFGRLSLQLKDDEAAERNLPYTLPEGAPPPFELKEGGKKHLIAFSLWGNDPRYLRGAIRNAQAAVDVYPGWKVRFYCDDSVPSDTIERLLKHGCEIMMRPRPETFFDGLLWRFEVVNDPGVERYLIRDCDSVVNVKERLAVDAWLRSDKWFHVMRDFPSHTEVILAGMWGGVVGALPSVAEIREAFKPTTAPTRTFDQILLREAVWPVVRESVLIHDSVYTGVLGGVPFPEGGELPFNYHVGQNESAVRPHIYLEASPTGDVVAPQVFVAGVDEHALASCRAVLEATGQLEWIDASSFRSLRDGISGMTQQVTGLRNGEAVPPQYVGELFKLTLSAVASRKTNAKTKWVAYEERGAAVEWLEGMLTSASRKILCVIRDPRETARARKVRDEGEAQQFAEDWKHQIEVVIQIGKRRKGMIEVVRHEDLFGKASLKAIENLKKYLGIELPEATEGLEPETSLEDPLPSEVVSKIEEVGAEWMKKLRYLA